MPVFPINNITNAAAKDIQSKANKTIIKYDVDIVL